MIERFFVRDVTIIHPAEVAASRGAGTEWDWDNATETSVKGWLHQLAESELQTATRDAEVSTHVLRLPAGTGVQAIDRIQIDGQTFEVDGPASHAWRPGGEHHIRVPLRYVDG